VASQQEEEEQEETSMVTSPARCLPLEDKEASNKEGYEKSE
jgi:hypothetical protein